jgi:arginyl-tRNA synthetase
MLVKADILPQSKCQFWCTIPPFFSVQRKMQSYKTYLNSLFSDALSRANDLPPCNANVITSSRPEFGDYQVNGVMAIAKQLKMNPRELAAKVVDSISIEQENLIEKLEIAGPGFINIHLSSPALVERANKIISGSLPLVSASAVSQTIVVDYSAPNLAKEMHVGHLRGTIIGDSLVRILEYIGHDVIRQNHVGDWGTQFGMLISYMQEMEKDGVANKLSDLETFYRAAKEKFDSDPTFANTARASVVKLQQGEQEYLDAWKTFIEESLSHCQAVYDKLNVTLTREHLDAESFYNDQLPVIVNELEAKSLLQTSDGAKVVFLPEFVGKEDEPLPTIIQKSDGGYLYATTDLAAVKYRSFNLKADRSLYVVDARQSLHFQQVFAVAKKAGFSSDNISLEHIAYGTMMGKDGKPFKTRSGDTVKLVELLDEAIKRAYDLVTTRSEELAESERKLIAREIGIAAVKYADLSKNRTSDYIFDWSSMLSFEGNTAPYLMYAYARIHSILAKVSSSAEKRTITSCASEEERALLIKLLQFPEIVHSIANDCFPNQLCNYLYELASQFMRFYEACPILKADKGVMDSRLALSELCAQTLGQGLDLLGINTLDKM